MHGGGSTNVKQTVLDFQGETVDVLWIKGSGWAGRHARAGRAESAGVAECGGADGGAARCAPESLHLVDAVARLRLESERDKKALVKVLAAVIQADEVIEESEKKYLDELAAVLGVMAG